MSREEMLRTSDGTELPLIPEPLCRFCSNPISEKWASLSGRCWFCDARLKAARAERAAKANGLAHPVNADSFRPFAFRRAAAVGLYVPDAPNKGEFGRRVADFKYHGRGGAVLAEALVLVMERRYADLKVQAFVPVPPEPGNPRNAPLELAKTLQARTGIPVIEAISMSHDYHSDKGASRDEKFAATEGKFDVQHAPEIRGLRIGLVDDVLTTCGHVHWAAKALREAGAASVDAVALARNYDMNSLKALGYKGRF